MILNKPFHIFESEKEKNVFLQKYKLRSENPRKEPVYYYKGRDVTQATICDILGYGQEFSDCATIVIDYGQGTCFINSLFLKQMQSSSFNIDKIME